MQIKSEIEQVKNQNGLKVSEKEREIGEKERIYCAKIEQEKKEAKEEFLLAKSEVLKEKEELTIEAKLFKAAAEEQLSIKIGEFDMAYELARDQNTMKSEAEQ